MSAWFAVRLEYPLFLDDRPNTAHRIAEILTRPCFSTLKRLSARQGRRWVKHTPISTVLVAEALLDRANDGVALDSGRAALIASAAVSNGQAERNFTPSVTRLESDVVIPWEPARAAETLESVGDLAKALDARAGAVSVEPDHGLARDFSLAANPKRESGLSEQRRRERRARMLREDDIATQLAGPEWGVFLGAGHLERLARERITADTLRAAGVFERVVSLTPALVFLQLTADPADALGLGLDARLDDARQVLAPILMDLSEIVID